MVQVAQVHEETINGKIYQEIKRDDGIVEYYIYTSVEERAEGRYTLFLTDKDVYVAIKLEAVRIELIKRTL